MKHNLMDIDLMCDMWEAWTLWVNFMYKDFQDKWDLVCIIFKPRTLASALIQLKEARYLVLIAGSPSILAKWVHLSIVEKNSASQVTFWKCLELSKNLLKLKCLKLKRLKL
jgi:hypothetical protein